MYYADPPEFPIDCQTSYLELGRWFLNLEPVRGHEHFVER